MRHHPTLHHPWRWLNAGDGSSLRVTVHVCVWVCELCGQVRRIFAGDIVTWLLQRVAHAYVPLTPKKIHLPSWVPLAPTLTLLPRP